MPSPRITRMLLPSKQIVTRLFQRRGSSSSQHHRGHYSRHTIYMTIGAVVLFIYFLSVIHIFLRGLFHDDDNPWGLCEAENTLEDILASRQGRPRNVVLLGPHERYNFGDLLFTKVLVRLLQNRAGYTSDEILFGAVAPNNMTRYGGEETILGMKTIQTRSREDTIKGPYDIVYTGGESAGCFHEMAVNFLPDEKSKDLARSEQIYGCGYLVPKSLLASDMCKPTNLAVVNSIGKGRVVNPDCGRAIDSADYVAFRDIDPLYPDSAVMTKELYGQEIDNVARAVLEELFPRITKKKYIAVQFKENLQFSIEQLATSLDTVSRGTNTTVIFFAAGTAPGHDSLALYKEVSLSMKEPNIVYEAENVWNVVALISQAEAVLSSSLHVRIMAFIYFKPRVTWCTETKHELFIDNWDANDSARCVRDLHRTWVVLSQYYGEHPDVSQNETKLVYAKTVKKYLESFDKWSSMLRPRTGKSKNAVRASTGKN